MANTQAFPTSAKKEFLCGSHALGAQAANAVRAVTTKDVLKIALFLTTAALGAGTTAYAATGELAATGNYAAGGVAVTNANDPVVVGTTGCWTPSASASWTNLTSSGAFDCALLYNSSSTGALAIGVFTFGAQSVTAGTFNLTMPVNDAANALVRLA